MPLHSPPSAVTPRAEVPDAPAGGRVDRSAGGQSLPVRDAATRKCCIFGLCLLAILLSSCGDEYGVAEVAAALSKVPGVRVNAVRARGVEWPYGPTDYTADLTVGNDGHLFLCGLTRATADEQDPFQLACVGQWSPYLVGPRDVGRVQRACLCPDSIEIGPGSSIDLLVPVPLRTVRDIVLNYPTLEALVASWPDRTAAMTAPNGGGLLWCRKSPCEPRVE